MRDASRDGRKDIERISAWVVERGLAGDSEIALLHGFCERCHEAGLPLSRGVAIIDTLHPVYEGRAFFWAGDKAVESPVSEYGPSTDGQRARSVAAKPVLLSCCKAATTSCAVGLRRTSRPASTSSTSCGDEGQTDYIAMVQRFGQEAAIGEMDCFLSRWLTMRPGGFSDADLAALRRLVPLLGLAIKSTSLARVAQSLVETYLGRDAGRRVLAGRMSRGAVDKIHAVLWFSDIRDYTALSEDMASDQLIPLLDDYAEAVISAVHGAGGDVLKLIGDGVLAIFAADDPAAASRSALQAEAALQLNLAALKERAPGSATAGRVDLCRHPYRRRLLRQYRQQGPPRLYGRRRGRERNEPHLVDVRLGRARRPVLVRFSSRPCRMRTSRSSCRSAAMRCAASAGRRNCSRSISDSVAAALRCDAAHGF